MSPQDPHEVILKLHKAFHNYMDSNVLHGVFAPLDRMVNEYLESIYKYDALNQMTLDHLLYETDEEKHTGIN